MRCGSRTARLNQASGSLMWLWTILVGLIYTTLDAITAGWIINFSHLFAPTAKYDLSWLWINMIVTITVNFLRRTVLNQGAARRTLLTLSSVEGPLEPPLSTLTLSEYFRSEILAKHHSRPALICPREPSRLHGGPSSQSHINTKYLAWDFSEFDRHIEALARGLISLGVKKGDRVGVIMGNTRWGLLTVHVQIVWNSCHLPVHMHCFNGHAQELEQSLSLSIHPIVLMSSSVPVSISHPSPSLDCHKPKVQALKLVGVSTLFVVPSLRSSDYLSMLSSAVPSLSASTSNNVFSEMLPELRSLVLVDNTSGDGRFETALAKVKSSIDYREVFMWHQSPAEDRQMSELSKTMIKDDIINLQFTRFGTIQWRRGVAD